jgi:hypothetical protein
MSDEQRDCDALRLKVPGVELAASEDRLAASAVSGQVPPAGPQWLRGLSQPLAAPLGYDKPLCASLDGFTLHATTRRWCAPRGWA